MLTLKASFTSIKPITYGFEHLTVTGSDGNPHTIYVPV